MHIQGTLRKSLLYGLPLLYATLLFLIFASQNVGLLFCADKYVSSGFDTLSFNVYNPCENQYMDEYINFDWAVSTVAVVICVFVLLAALYMALDDVWVRAKARTVTMIFLPMVVLGIVAVISEDGCSGFICLSVGPLILSSIIALYVALTASILFVSLTDRLRNWVSIMVVWVILVTLTSTVTLFSKNYTRHDVGLYQDNVLNAMQGGIRPFPPCDTIWNQTLELKCEIDAQRIKGQARPDLRR